MGLRQRHPPYSEEFLDEIKHASGAWMDIAQQMRVPLALVCRLKKTKPEVSRNPRTRTLTLEQAAKEMLNRRKKNDDVLQQ